jgi:uncharacterized repeat protein (TIGR01451 family)
LLISDCSARISGARVGEKIMKHLSQIFVLLLLLVLTVPAWGQSYSDPCTNPSAPQLGALPVGSATGCGVIITVTSTGFTITIPNNGNGNPYDGDDDTLVGIVNNSSETLNSITLNSTDLAFGGIFGFDQDGPCQWAAQHNDNPNDCYPSPPIDGYTPSGYEGPDNTFTDISSDFTTGTVSFITGIPPGGTTWFALEGSPQSITAITQTGSPMNPNNPANLNQQFTFNSAAGEEVQFNFNYNTAFNTNNDLMVQNNTIPTVNDQGVDQATYQQLVAGTALATTQCYIAPGEGTDENGNPLCAELTLECTNANNPSPAGDNCPQSEQRNLLFSHLLNTNATVSIPAGTAPTLAEGSDVWTPSNCLLVGPEAGDLCPQSLLTALTVSSDPVITPGGTGKTSNSSFIAGCCEPEWTTVPTVPIYSNKTTVPVSFNSTPPAAPPLPNNNWVAAPNQSITWGWEPLGQTPDPTFPVAGDQTVTNSTACPSVWPSPGKTPPSASASGNVMVSGEGAFELHFFSTACDNQEELLFIPQSSPTANWAAFRTAPFNVDLTPPTVSGLTLNPAPVNGTYVLNQPVTASLICTDPVSNGVASGIAMCGPGSTNFGGQNPVTVTNTTVPTSALGTFSFGATDVAGNAVTAFTYAVVNPSADLEVIKLGPLLAATNTNVTYVIGAWDNGPGSASSVVVSDALPSGETLVSASWALVTCSWSGCKEPPPGSASCTLSNNTATCNVGTLPAIQKGATSFTGVGIKLVAKVTAKAGTTIKNTATVTGANPDPNLGNNSFTWPTLVTKF